MNSDNTMKTTTKVYSLKFKLDLVTVVHCFIPIDLPKVVFPLAMFFQS